FETLAKAVQLCRANGLPGLRCVIRTPHDVEIDQPGLEVLHEQVSWTQLREAYRQANVVVLPLFDSLHPGGINTLLEAMAIGRPVVLSDSRGIRDYVCDRETARVVEPGSPAMLAAAIGELLADRDAAAAMGMRARAWVEKHCRSRVYAEALARHLRDAYVKVFPAKPLPADQTRNVSAPCPDECETLT
ncbi:MAG: glycosyltransferase, partial [Planctomycetota bacterium]